MAPQPAAGERYAGRREGGSVLARARRDCQPHSDGYVARNCDLSNNGYFDEKNYFV